MDDEKKMKCAPMRLNTLQKGRNPERCCLSPTLGTSSVTLGSLTVERAQLWSDSLAGTLGTTLFLQLPYWGQENPILECFRGAWRDQPRKHLKPQILYLEALLT